MGKIKIDGKTVRADLTGGALLRFKRERGYDFLKNPERMDSEGLLTLAWAAAKATAVANGEKFSETVESMADKMSLEEVNAIGEWIKGETSGGDEPDEEPSEDGKSKKKKTARG